MRIVIAADHAGFNLKCDLAAALADAGRAVTDLGVHSEEPVDYPDVAASVGHAVVEGRADRGIIICGSGAGVVVAANKIKGVRCAQAHDTYTAHQCVEHDDVNVLALGSRVIGPALAKEIVFTFLGATFSGIERHMRRVGKVIDLENNFG